MRDEAGTKLHIKIKGNKNARKKMIELMDVLEDEGVEICLEIKTSTLRSKKIRLEGSDD